MRMLNDGEWDEEEEEDVGSETWAYRYDPETKWQSTQLIKCQDDDDLSYRPICQLMLTDLSSWLCYK
jgi:hypothetical protein